MRAQGQTICRAAAEPAERCAARAEGPAAPGYAIGDLARECGLTLSALRFYESKGLLQPTRIGSLRRYGETDRRRLQLILKGKQLGFTLREIRALIAAEAATGDSPGLALTRRRCIEQIQHLERRKREIETALGELRRAYAALADPARDERLRLAG